MRRPARATRAGVRGLALLSVSAAFVLPFLWMVSTSLKEETAIVRLPPELVPDPVRIENYAEALDRIPFLLATRNTILLTVLSVIGHVLAAGLTGYALARLRFPGRGAVLGLVLAALILPEQVTLVPQFLVFRELGWIDSFWPLAFPCYLAAAPQSAFFVFFFRQWFLTLPRGVEEAARLDGCSRLGVFWRVLLPMSLPAVAAVSTFAFLWTWNDFLRPLLYLHRREIQTLPLALQEFQEYYGTSDVHLLMAASTMALLPCILLYVFAQRPLTRSIGLGTGKG